MMNKFAVWSIGAVALLGAVVLGYVGTVAGHISPRGPTPIFIMAGFFGVIALACFFTASRPITLRIIGAVIFMAFAIYVLTSLNTDNLGRAVAGFIGLGVPAGYMAWLGRWPDWGRGSAAFERKSED